jgi:hypothetical protein
MIGWFIQKQYVGRTRELPSKSQSSPLSAAQLRDRLRARRLCIEAKTLQDSVDSRRERIPTFAVEPLEITVVPCKHLGSRALAGFSQLVCLFGERMLEGEKVGKFSGSGFPNGGRSTEIAVLLQERDS